MTLLLATSCQYSLSRGLRLGRWNRATGQAPVSHPGTRNAPATPPVRQACQSLGAALHSNPNPSCDFSSRAGCLAQFPRRKRDKPP
ncbi:hypothetical protein ASAP_1466 [Asaia bogorensis]|uniref:Uncharacterized protein n=1 Tax=Asaia bogorensis TaxID=91915 RepID=A0A060QJR6_9PROT|nr:hypothetical protein ASAP_1466 [Asaia bogorensis]